MKPRNSSDVLRQYRRGSFSQDFTSPQRTSNKEASVTWAWFQATLRTSRRSSLSHIRTIRQCWILNEVGANSASDRSCCTSGSGMMYSGSKCLTARRSSMAVFTSMKSSFPA
ncbi:MAG: hypothetical protein BWY09_03182 [Candidatus Hydrogenedentes bacterium ADurb.Bin179]|nr:MAG: hypothetical protein BWY09_03182 [Candidatus Hydrogenedentes bacterium ADurb.Bin179]